MVFGLGRKKQEATPAAQISPEAMAMLTQMAQQTADQMASPLAPGMPATGLRQDPQAQNSMPSVDLASEEPDNSNLTSKEQRRLAREQKKAAALAAKEEKARQRRARKGAKSRFSRARYLREANGNAATGVALASILLALTLVGPVLLNALYLLPQTSENREIANQVQTYNDVIRQAEPLLQIAVTKKTDRENEIQSYISNFKDGPTVTTELRQFVSDLEARGATLTSETSRTVTNSDVGVAGLAGKTLAMDMEADFLSYLLVRNKLARAQPSIAVAKEEIFASPGVPIVAIKLELTVPARQ